MREKGGDQSGQPDLSGQPRLSTQQQRRSGGDEGRENDQRKKETDAHRSAAASHRELVAYPSNGIDDVAGWPQLLAKPLDVRIHRSGGDFGLDSPDIGKQHLSGLNAPRALQERLQQAELERGESDL